MTLITQDGNTFDLQKKNRPTFAAGTYVGHINYCFVEATVHVNNRSRVNITLGEYETLDEAKAVKDQVETAFETGAKLFIMRGNNGVAPADNLQALLNAIDTLRGAYYFDIGTVTGRTNSETVFDLNPDENGSFDKCIARIQGKEEQAA